MSYAEPLCELVARNAQSDATTPDASPNERIKWIGVFAHRDSSGSMAAIRTCVLFNYCNCCENATGLDKWGNRLGGAEIGRFSLGVLSPSAPPPKNCREAHRAATKP